MRLVLTAVFAVGIAFAQAPGDPPEVDPPDVKFTLKLAQDPAYLHAGEPIRLQLFFSATSAGRYVVSTGSGLCGMDEMHVEPRELAAVPGEALQSFGGRAFSILSGIAPLTEEPVAVDCELNERFRFDHPGSFHLWVNSPRVSRLRGPREPGDGAGRVLVKSTVIDFQILELAPSDARDVLVREIRNPRTGLKAATLGRLEDATIPELDASLLERLRGQLDGTAEGPPELTVYLIHRYATPKIYAGVREVYAKKAGLWACAIQTPLLAYFLRADEKDGMALIDQALAPNGKTGCHHSLLREVAALRWVPALEKTALARLWGADAEVAGNAAIMLGEYGSAESEAPLWKRFEAWSEQWQGRETELRFNMDGRQNPNWPQSVLEDNLARGLIDGKAWELTGAQRSRVASLCVTASCRSMAAELVR
jgi:hypothetical protein